VLAQVRDQLWAEAVRLYRAKVAWWLLNPEAIQEAQAEQLARLTDDPWEDLISNYIANKIDVTVPKLLEVLGIPRSWSTEAI
jgi:predicted P-loop ATPase